MPQANKNSKTKSQSSKQVRNGSGQRTKAADTEFREQLVQAEEKLKNLQEELRVKSDRIQTLQPDVEKLKNENQILKEEKDTLEKKLSALEKSTAKEMAKVKRNLRETERQLNNMTTENENLAKKAEEVDTIEAATATFQIYINSEEGNYRGRIVHNLSKDILKFSDLDFEALNDFIKKHIPATREEVVAEAVPVSPELPPAETEEAAETSGVDEVTVSQVAPASSLLGQVRLVQAGERFDIAQAVRSNEDFSLQLNLQFPDVLSSASQQENPFAFEVDVVAKDADNAVVAKNGFADEVPLGTQDYECSIKMPQLKSGNYQLNIYTTIPDIQLLSRDVIEVQVDYN